LREENETATQDIIVEAGGEAIHVQTDVGVATQMEELVKVTAKTYGQLDMYAIMHLPQ
jgi:hypothetical protein